MNPAQRAVIGLSVLLVACGEDPTTLICTEEARPGIVATVREDGTGLPAADGATLTLQDGSYTESTSFAYGGLKLAGATERAGAYDVAVARPGFHTWIRPDVVVHADQCHVITVRLEARIRRIE